MKGYRAAFINPNSKLLGPKFKFAKHGKSGAELSELLPHTANIVDDIAIVKSMTTDAFNHAPGQILMNTGTMQFGRPSMGAWMLYGLGSESRDLPAFVVFSSGIKGPSGGDSCWGSGFLPTVYQGVQFRSSGDPVLYLSNPAGVDAELQRDSLDSLRKLNEMQLGVVGDPGDRHAHQLVRDGLPHAVQRSGGDGHLEGIEEDARSCTAPSRASRLRQQLPAGPPAGRAGRAFRPALSRGVGSAHRPGPGHHEELPTTPTRPARR